MLPEPEITMAPEAVDWASSGIVAQPSGPVPLARVRVRGFGNAPSARIYRAIPKVMVTSPILPIPVPAWGIGVEGEPRLTFGAQTL